MERGLAHNILLNLGGNIIPLVVALAAMPVVLHLMGSARFGLLSLSWAVLGYFGLADLGIGRAATRFLAEARSRNDSVKTFMLYRTALSLQIVLGVLAGLAVFCATPWLTESLLSVPAGMELESRRVFHILAVSLPIVLLFNGLRGLLEASNRFDLVNALKVPFNSANFALPAVGAMLGWTLPSTVFGLVVLRLMATLIQWRMLRALIPRPANTDRYIDASIVRDLASFGSWVTASSVINPALVYLDRFAIGSILGLSAAGFYSLGSEASMRVLVLPVSFAATLFPAFSGMTRGSAVASDVFHRSVKYLFLLMFPPVVLLTAFARPLLELWVGSEAAAQATLPLQILLAGVLMNALAHVPMSYLHGAGRPDLTAKFHIVEVVVYIPVLLLLTRQFGLPGAAASAFFRASLDAALLFGAAARDLPSPRVDMRRAFAYAGAVVAVIAAVAAGALLPAGLPVRVAAAIVLLAVPAGAAWQLLLEPAERARLRGYLRLARLG